MYYLYSLGNYLLSYIPIINGIKKNYDFMSIVNNITKSFNILKDKKITLLNVSETLYEDNFIKITSKANLGAKIISDEKPIETIKFEDKEIVNQKNKFFDKIMEIKKKLNNYKKNPEIESYKKDIFNFNKIIGDNIINGKLYIFINENRDEIKLIFEINDTYQKAQILGLFELTFKFKNEGLEAIKNYSVYISKKITIEEEKSVEEKSVDEKIVLCLYFLVMISIEFLVNGEEGVSKFLSWLDSIEKNKAFEPKDYAYFNNQYKLNN